jgi:hypothetical protein
MQYSRLVFELVSLASGKPDREKALLSKCVSHSFFFYLRGFGRRVSWLTTPIPLSRFLIKEARADQGVPNPPHYSLIKGEFDEHSDDGGAAGNASAASSA